MPASGLSSRDFRVGDWVVRPRLSQIQRGSRAVHVTPRAMAVLVHLAEAGGAVVSRNAMLDAVWPHMAVTPDALSRCLVELRKAFGNGADATPVIETIPKVGIRLTLPVGSAEVSTVPTFAHQPRAPRWAFARTALVGAAAIAVVGGAALVLWRGTITGPNDGIRTSSTAARELYLSASDYAQRPNRLEALRHQEDLYRRALTADPQFALAWAQLGRTHMESYWYGLDRTPERLTSAEQALRRALEFDENLPEAHLYLADYYFKGRDDAPAALAELAVVERSAPRSPEVFFLRSMVERRVGQWEAAVHDGQAAIDLAPRNVVYRRQLQVTLTFMRDYARARQTLDSILDVAPDDGTTFVDKVVLDLLADGDTALAGQYEAARPSPQYEHGLAYTYSRWLAAILDRDYARAMRALDEANEDPVFNGDLRTSRIPKEALVARTRLLAGDVDRARRDFAEVAVEMEAGLARASPGDAIAASADYLTVAEALVESGQRERGIEWMRRARNLVPKGSDTLSGSATQLASIVRVLIPARELDEALSELDDYLAGRGQWSIEGLSADPRLDPIRDDSRFATLVAKYERR